MNITASQWDQSDGGSAIEIAHDNGSPYSTLSQSGRQVDLLTGQSDPKDKKPTASTMPAPSAMIASTVFTILPGLWITPSTDAEENRPR
ncbi:hypothetical protein WHX55_16035 [Pseudomonas fluorescens]|uniref:hypothetical protein n=1 Tax=Pseudomonas fluorescens TaxID=294 RepID=UPI0032464675